MPSGAHFKLKAAVFRKINYSNKSNSNLKYDYQRSNSFTSIHNRQSFLSAILLLILKLKYPSTTRQLSESTKSMNNESHCNSVQFFFNTVLEGLFVAGLRVCSTVLLWEYFIISVVHSKSIGNYLKAGRT